MNIHTQALHLFQYLVTVSTTFRAQDKNFTLFFLLSDLIYLILNDIWKIGQLNNIINADLFIYLFLNLKNHSINHVFSAELCVTPKQVKMCILWHRDTHCISNAEKFWVLSCKSWQWTSMSIAKSQWTNLTATITNVPFSSPTFVLVDELAALNSFLQLVRKVIQNKEKKIHLNAKSGNITPCILHMWRGHLCSEYPCSLSESLLCHEWNKWHVITQTLASHEHSNESKSTLVQNHDSKLFSRPVLQTAQCKVLTQAIRFTRDIMSWIIQNFCTSAWGSPASWFSTAYFTFLVSNITTGTPVLIPFHWCWFCLKPIS